MCCASYQLGLRTQSFGPDDFKYVPVTLMRAVRTREFMRNLCSSHLITSSLLRLFAPQATLTVMIKLDQYTAKRAETALTLAGTEILDLITPSPPRGSAASLSDHPQVILILYLSLILGSKFPESPLFVPLPAHGCHELRHIHACNNRYYAQYFTKELD